MSSSSEGLIDRLRGLVDLSHEKTMTEDWTVFKRLDACIFPLKSHVLSYSAYLSIGKLKVQLRILNKLSRE